MKTAPHIKLPIATTDGEFTARYSDAGLAGLDFPRRKTAARPASANVPARVRRWHVLTEKAVKAVLAGRTPRELPPLDISRGTDFQRRVWEELLWTPGGETRSYGEIARTIRKPNAVRAVGGACGANPLPLLIPCHRVLAANRRIGGFSGGLAWKRKLLEREGAVLAQLS